MPAFPKSTVNKPSRLRNLERGKEAEDSALAFLCAHGHRLVARNFRCRQGEIDLITLASETLVFIEVRLRQRSDFGSAAMSVTPHKQARIIHAARYFLHRHPAHQHRDCRFDIIAFDQGSQPQWIENAFEV